MPDRREDGWWQGLRRRWSRAPGWRSRTARWGGRSPPPRPTSGTTPARLTSSNTRSRTGRSARRPIRRSWRTSGRQDPKHWRGRVGTLADGAAGCDRDRPRLGDRRGDVAPRGAFAAAGVRGVGRTPGPAVDADRSDAVPLVRSDARPGRALRLARSQHHRQVPGDLGRRPGHGGSDLPRASTSMPRCRSACLRLSRPARPSSAGCVGGRPRACGSTTWDR